MMGPTHATLGILATSLILKTVDPVILGIGAISALLPDIDSSKSTIGRLLPGISKRIERRVPHRTATHSFCAIALIALLSGALSILWKQGAAALLIGFTIGGICGDLMTASGVELAWPWYQTAFVFPGNPQLRFITGRKAEIAIITIIWMITIWSLNIASNGGAIRVLKQAMGTPSVAVEFFNEQSGSAIVYTQVKGWRESDRTPINQRFRIIEANKSSFLLQDEQGRLHRAAESGEVEIIIQRMRTKTGATIRQKVTTIQLDDQPVLKTIKKYKADEIYISGTLEIDDLEDLKLPEPADQYWAVRKTETKLELDNARPEQLKSLQDRYGTGTLEIKLINGQ
ncbi:MAG: metal-dependent hydrolase [Xenococcaceae cyanobacterium]